VVPVRLPQAGLQKTQKEIRRQVVQRRFRVFLYPAVASIANKTTDIGPSISPWHRGPPALLGPLLQIFINCLLHQLITVGLFELGKGEK
jgi:hypothetical protein